MDNEVNKIENNTKKKFNFIKLLSKKNLKIIILSILALILLIVFINFDKPKKSNLNIENRFNGYNSTLNYCAELESKLQDVLSNVKGAGNIKVMLSVEGSPELIYAVDSDKKETTNSSGSTTTSSSSPIIVESNGNSSPIILTESLPKVKGVVIVSSGASDVKIKLDILNAVSTLLDISSDKISILNGI